MYADETIFEGEINGVKHEYAGYGVLKTSAKISQEIIKAALIELESDPDRNHIQLKEIDRNTLNSGFFHASQDSKNAHSHLCRQISSKIKCEIAYTFFPLIKTDRKKRLSEVFLETLHLTSLEIFQISSPITFIIEERDDFTKKDAELAIEKLFEKIDQSLFSHNWQPTFYPRIEIQVKGKHEAGLQVLDFILWSIVRKQGFKKKDEWFNRLPIQFSTTAQSESGDMFFGTCNLNRFKYTNKIIEYPEKLFKIPDIQTKDELIQRYIVIEKTIKLLTKNKIPKELGHFTEKISEIENLLKINNQSIELIKKICTIYIRIFDMLPIHNERNRIFMLQARKIASHLLHSDIYSIRDRDYILWYRKKNLGTT